MTSNATNNTGMSVGEGESGNGFRYFLGQLVIKPGYHFWPDKEKLRTNLGGHGLKLWSEGPATVSPSGPRMVKISSSSQRNKNGWKIAVDRVDLVAVDWATCVYYRTQEAFDARWNSFAVTRNVDLSRPLPIAAPAGGPPPPPPPPPPQGGDGGFAPPPRALAPPPPRPAPPPQAGEGGYAPRPPVVKPEAGGVKPEPGGEIRRLTRERDTARIDALTAQLETEKARTGRAEAEKQTLEMQRDAIKAQHIASSTENDELKKQLDEEKKKSAGLAEELNKAQANLKRVEILRDVAERSAELAKEETKKQEERNLACTRRSQHLAEQLRETQARGPQPPAAGANRQKRPRTPPDTVDLTRDDRDNAGGGEGGFHNNAGGGA
jgi:hypothetical protein